MRNVSLGRFCSAAELLQEQVRTNHKPAPGYEACASPPPAGTARAVDLYAFYLPQFHRVPENDEWWGEGFTEWHNVVRGVPRFEGHYQPRIPSALGFYDLSDPRVITSQVALAKQAGVSGFAFYYYHFGSQRLLEKPVEQFLSDTSLKLGYFFIWANETWSRRWDGSEAEVLLEQTYPAGIRNELVTDLLRHFADPRYRRIGGRPLFVIYRVSALPEAKAWIDALRDAFAARGVNPVLYMAQTFEDLDPRTFGLDGALEFPPHKYSLDMSPVVPERLFPGNPALRVWNYDEFVSRALSQPRAPFPLIRTCFPSWDNDSRRQGASSVVHGSTPEKYAQWLNFLVEQAAEDPGDLNLVCVNAWNEWGEGAYLEPDRHYGYAYLNATQRVMHPERPTRYGPILLVGHDAFPAGAQRLLLNMGRDLKFEYGIDVAFLILRAESGYDGLVPEYRKVAPTWILPDGSPDGIPSEISEGRFRHAIVNSSASSSILPVLGELRIPHILLVHELKEMIRSLKTEPLLAGAGTATKKMVVSSTAGAEFLTSLGVEKERLAHAVQGQYRRLKSNDGGTERPARRRGDRKPLMVSSLGYADKRKGADTFVRTCAAAAQMGENMLFVWKGDWDPDLRAQLADEIAHLEASGHLKLEPASSEIEQVLYGSDVFLLASREDPFPSVAIEAWSAGLPVVAVAHTGGVAEMLETQPHLGVLAGAPQPSSLLDAIREAARSGVQQNRAEWAASEFNWHHYLRRLLHWVYEPPVVDVAIVGHKHLPFAPERLRSLLLQTLPPRRITYYDVASPPKDQSSLREIAEACGVNFEACAPNHGKLYETWHQVASASDAAYLHIAEGDDSIEPMVLERCVQALENQPGAAYAFVPVAWVDAGGNLLANHAAYLEEVLGAKGPGAISPASFLKSDFLVKNPILSMSSVVWNREVLLKTLEGAQGNFARTEFAFDWLLYIQAAKSGFDAVYVPEGLCYHRQHVTSFANRADLERHIQEIENIYLLVPEGSKSRRKKYLRSLAQRP